MKFFLHLVLIFYLISSINSYSFITRSTSSFLPSFQKLSGKTSSSGFIFTGNIKKGRLSPPRKVPFGFKKPDYVKSSKIKRNNFFHLKRDTDPYYIPLLSEEEMKIMREGGVIARKILDQAISSIKPGITTDQIDEIVHNQCISYNVYPSPLYYNSFPKSCCTSCNEVLCHGIPELDLVLKEGDVINLDITIFHKGLHIDCSESVLVFDGGKEKLEKFSDQVDLIKVSRNAFLAGMNAVKVNENFNKIGNEIENYIKKEGNYAILRDFCGHGIGKDFHSYPNVLHYSTYQNLGIIRPCQAFTIEPIIKKKLDKNEPILTTSYLEWPDNWTIVSKDGAPSAQFEDTFLINNDGKLENLTEKKSKFFWEV